MGDYSNPMELLQQISANEPGKLPMPSSFPSAEEVRSKAGPLSKSILEHWDMLNTIIQRHEATIQKRWAKKTKESRRKILLAVWPNMSASHRPDLQAFRANPTRQGGKAPSGHRSAYLCPYINLEDLVKSKLLLLFLNSRGRNPPYAFARADIEACHFGITSGAIMPAFLNEHVMMFTGRSSPETYGELLSWDDHPDAFDWLQSQRGAHPGEGLMILEIQDRLYMFLVQLCKLILHEFPQATLVDPSNPVQPEPPSVSASATGLASLATTAAEAPYRLPAALDLNRLESFVGAKLSAVEDHILALREDPGYFARVVLDWKDHRQELLPDTSGHEHPLLRNPFQEQVFWERVVGNVLVTAMSNLEAWYSIHERVVNLRHLQAKFADVISPEEDLPKEYAIAIYRFHYHLEQFSKGPIELLKVGFVASPPMRPFFLRRPQDPTNTIIQIIQKTNVPKDKEREEVTWIMMTLFDAEKCHLAGLNTLVDELDRLMQGNSKAQQFISSWVEDQISDLSVLSQCMHQIKLYQPWAATFEEEMATLSQDLREDYCTVLNCIRSFHQPFFRGRLAVLGNPSEEKFHYPVDKPRNRKTTEAMRQAEANLDAFWSALCEELDRKGSITPRLRRLLELPTQRTPAWIDAVTTAKSAANALVTPMSQLGLQLEHSTERTISREIIPPRKQKEKTRGVATQVDPSPGAEPLDHPTPERPPTFKVDKRALKVFKTLFFEESASNQPGEISWSDFLHAMTAAGFTFWKGAGSKWQFNPTGLGVDRGIQFHEPHPVSKIPYVMARRHGRRLHRAYGWTGDMFVLG
jgi:hypothetical protein